MSHKNIYILTGQINSGKTTAISNWAFERKDVFGILTPKVSGKRIFQIVESGHQFEMEATINEKNVEEIGRYKFSTKAFEKASLILQRGLQNSKGWLVVDEIGPLELQQKGFYQVVNEIVTDKNNGLKKLLVVREGLLDEVIFFFKIEKPAILTLPLRLQ